MSQCSTMYAVRVAAGFVQTMSNASISQGTLANIVREMPGKSRPAIELLGRLMKELSVAGLDEPGCRADGKLNWSWIAAQPTYLTLVFRGAKVLEERLGGSLENIVAVAGRRGAYFAIDFLAGPDMSGPSVAAS